MLNMTDLKIEFHNRVLWHLKQLLPLTYRTKYGDANGKKHYCVWKMWMGRCYAIDDYIVGDWHW